jgi:hypothetical protein
MADDLKPNEQAVFILCEWTAGAWVFGAVESLREGKPIWLVLLFVVLAIFFAVFGVTWPTFKLKLGSKFSQFISTVERISSDYRYRTVGKVLLAVAVALILTSYLRSLRDDVDTYLVPRTLTKAQSEELGRAVAGVHSDIKINVLFPTYDPEAREYAGQLFAAIRGSGWDIQLQPVNLWNPRDQPDNPFNNFVLAEGLGMEDCIPGQPTQEDEQRLRPATVLRGAIEEAGLAYPFQTGERADCGAYVANLIVGRRPFKLGQGPTLMQRLARWFSLLVQ